APPAPFLPEEVHGKPVVGVIVLYAGPIEKGEKLITSIRGTNRERRETNHTFEAIWNAIG
ncbi:MAG: hypothetical protein ACXACT_15945, partial [Candidatus Thorarchaeota archaeon]